MESKEIYDESYKELLRIRKELTGSKLISIDFSKLDSNSENELRMVLSSFINSRIGNISSIISGVR